MSLTRWEDTDSEFSMRWFLVNTLVNQLCLTRLTLLILSGKILTSLLISTTSLDGNVKEMELSLKLLVMLDSMTLELLIIFRPVSRYLSLISHAKVVLKSMELLLSEKPTIPNTTLIGQVLTVSLHQEAITSGSKMFHSTT